MVRNSQQAENEIINQYKTTLDVLQHQILGI